MTYLRPPGSRSSWNLFPGLGPQTYGKQVWSSGKLLEGNGQNKHLLMNHLWDILCHCGLKITKKKKLQWNLMWRSVSDAFCQATQSCWMLGNQGRGTCYMFQTVCDSSSGSAHHHSLEEDKEKMKNWRAEQSIKHSGVLSLAHDWENTSPYWSKLKLQELFAIVPWFLQHLSVVI